MSQQTEERKLDRERALDRLREAYPSGSIVSTVVWLPVGLSASRPPGGRRGASQS